MSAPRTTANNVEIQFRSYARTLWAHGGHVEGLALSRRSSRFMIERRNDDSSVSQPFGSATRSASEMWDMLRFAIDSLKLTPQLRSEGSSGVSTMSANVSTERMPANAAFTDEELGRAPRSQEREEEATDKSEELAQGSRAAHKCEHQTESWGPNEGCAEFMDQPDISTCDEYATHLVTSTDVFSPERSTIRLCGAHAELILGELLNDPNTLTATEEQLDSEDFGELVPAAVSASEAHELAVHELVDRGRWNRRQAELIVSHRESIGAPLLSSYPDDDDE